MKTIEQLKVELPSYKMCASLSDNLEWTDLVQEHASNPTLDTATKLSLFAQLHAEHAAAVRIKQLEEALRFYADGCHFHLHDESAWDTVSGEPQNFYEDDSNTATVEDGSIAKMALDGLVLAPVDQEN